MAGKEEMDYVYSLIDTISGLSLGETGDFERRDVQRGFLPCPSSRRGGQEDADSSLRTFTSGRARRCSTWAAAGGPFCSTCVAWEQKGSA